MKKKISLLLFIGLLVPSSLLCQRRLSRPIEVSPFFSVNISFSQLKIHRSNFKSPPMFNSDNYGIQIERQILKDTFNVYLNATFSTLDLSVGSKFQFIGSQYGFSSSTIISSTYNLLSLGVKKKITKHKGKNLNSAVETGLKLVFSQGGTFPSKYGRSDLLDTIITWQYTYDKERKITPIPYLGICTEYTKKKFKVGVKLWFQRSFYEILSYNYTVKYGNINLRTKSVSYGMALGLNLYFKLISF